MNCPSQKQINYLLKKGSCNPVYIGEIYKSQHQNQRLAGFKKTCEEAGITSIREFFIKPEEEEASALTSSLLKNSDTDGLFYFSDTLAYGGREAILKSSKKIPFIGYDDQSPCKYLGMSSIRQPGYLLGYEGTRSIISHITGGTKIPPRSFAPELIIRE